jgi:hypothetical protein
VALFRFLDDHAQKSDIGGDFAVLWRLFRTVAEDSSYADGFAFAYGLKEKVEQDAIRLEDIDQIIEYLRPRLKVEPLSSYAETRESPLHWVRWDFETSLDESSRRSTRIGRQHLQRLSKELLYAIIEKGTYALRRSLDVCKDIGWVGSGSDLPNYLVHRVFDIDPVEENDDEDRDPDNYNNNFAPIVRVLSLTLSVLADKDPRLANRAVSAWSDLSPLSGLYLRLAAFGSWNSRTRSSLEIGEFLTNMPSHPFWRWIAFPEVASMRAIRWNELEATTRETVSNRLLSGPDDAALRSDVQIDEVTKAYHRDHEIARLVDSSAIVDERMAQIVERRRASDPAFPRRVPTIELGLPAPRVTSVPPGKPDKFSNVPAEELIATLLRAQKERGFGEGDDAEAFVRTLRGRFRLLDALTLVDLSNPLLDPALDLLLSYPHEKSEDEAEDREVAQRIVNLAMTLPDDHVAKNARRLCYWIDGTDERLPQLDGIEDLWSRLLPSAEGLANQVDGAEHYSSESDLTMAALNEPLGHLLSVVLRRCHPIRDAKGSLPHHLFARLRELHGRAGELWANRMVVSMNYFMLVDAEWLNRTVIVPMKQLGAESDRLWEAFARYGKIPNAKLWTALQTPLLKRLYSADSTPDSKRRLAEMCVIVWIWSCRGDDYTLKASSLRSSLSLTNDDVRGAAAWQFASVFYGDRTKQNDPPVVERWREIGERFFDEVWPLEPILQSSASANDFARIPASVGSGFFEDAVSTIAPFLVPFTVWSVQTEFRLEIKEGQTNEIIQLHPEALLTLLSLCIAEDQGHRVFDLNGLLDQLSSLHPQLENDFRMQKLRRMAA